VTSRQAPGTAMADPAQVFVVGCYRSGTTLVERMVSCHPQATGLGFETLLLTHVVPHRPLPAFNAREWEKPLQRERPGAHSWEQVEPDRRTVFDAIARHLALERDASVFVEKTPFHLFHAERILSRDPDAKIVHVLRDGRDVVTSVLAGDYPVDRWPTRRLRLLAACALWELFAWEGQRLSQLEGDRLQTLRYEDVVKAPHAALERIAEFLNLDRSDTTLATWFTSTSKIGSNSSFEPLRGISNQPVCRWVEPGNLNPGEAAVIDNLLAPTLELVGYEPAGARLTPFRGCTAKVEKQLLALWRVARFRANTALLPPPRLWRYLRQSARRRA